MSERNPAWYGQLLIWLEEGMRTTTVQRMALRSTPLKLLQFDDSPALQHTTWSTYEHSDRTWQGPDVQVGYELVFSARGDVDGLTVLKRATEVLAAIERPPVPGTVLTDLLQSIDGIGPSLPHAVLVPAWSWSDFEPLVAMSRRVEAVAILPITEAELAWMRTEGAQALMVRLDEETPDLYAMGRTSVV